MKRKARVPFLTVITTNGEIMRFLKWYYEIISSNAILFIRGML